MLYLFRDLPVVFKHLARKTEIEFVEVEIYFEDSNSVGFQSNQNDMWDRGLAVTALYLMKKRNSLSCPAPSYTVLDRPVKLLFVLTSALRLFIRPRIGVFVFPAVISPCDVCWELTHTRTHIHTPIHYILYSERMIIPKWIVIRDLEAAEVRRGLLRTRNESVK